MVINKKTIIISAIAIVLIAGIATGATALMGAFNKKENTTTGKSVTPTETTVDNLKKQAEKARVSNDKPLSKELLQEAQKQNSELPKTDETTNTQVDIEAQLYLLEHAK